MIQTTLFPTQPHSYHNSVPLRGEELQKAEQNADRQEAIIHHLFQVHHQLTPWQCAARLNTYGYKWPITSIRRAITNLTEEGLLRKSGEKVTGPLGHKENQWEVVI